MLLLGYQMSMLDEYFVASWVEELTNKEALSGYHKLFAKLPAVDYAGIFHQ